MNHEIISRCTLPTTCQECPLNPACQDVKKQLSSVPQESRTEAAGLIDNLYLYMYKIPEPARSLRIRLVVSALAKLRVPEDGPLPGYRPVTGYQTRRRRNG